MSGEPTSDQSRIDAALSNFGVLALLDNQNLLANRLFPVVPVTKKSGKYRVLTPTEGLNDEHEESIPHGGVSTELNFEIGEAGYSVKMFGKRHLLTDDEAEDADPGMEDVLKGDELILTNMAIKREIAAADLVCEQDNFFANHWFAAAAGWNVSGTNPKIDVDAAVDLVELDSGFTPNVIVMPKNTYNIFTTNSNIEDKIKYMAGVPFLQSGMIPGDLVYNLKILKAGAVYDSGAPLETSSLGRIWERASTDAGDDWAFVAYIDPSPGRKSGGWGATFSFNNNRISDRDLVTAKVYYDDHRWGTWYDFRSSWAMLITNNRAGAMIHTIEAEVS